MKKVAAIQMCSSTNLEENLILAEKLIAEAAQNGAKLVVLPEMFSIMGAAQEKITAIEEFELGKAQQCLSEQAKLHKIWLVGGTIPIKNGTKARSACLIYNEEGKRIARYDKIHLFDVTVPGGGTYSESDTFEAGEEAVVVDTPFGKLGLAICYDIRFPALFMQLFERGAEIITLPAAFTQKTGEAHWVLLSRARAVENFCYFIGACQGGIHSNGRETFGHSLIVDPWGKVIAEQQKDGAGIVYADIDLDYLKKIRASIPIAEHRKQIL